MGSLLRCRQLVLTAAAGLALLGCDGDDGPDPAAPTVERETAETDADATLTLDGEHFTVQVPDSWELAEEREGLLRATSDDTGNAVVTVQVGEGEVVDIREAAAIVRTQDRASLPDYDESDWSEVEVSGADEALRDVATWTATRDGEDTARRGVNVYARAGERAVVLMVQSNEDAFEDAWVEPIVDSFEVRP